MMSFCELDSKPLSAIGHVVDSIGMDMDVPYSSHRPSTCRRCGIAIRDRFIVTIHSNSYHEGCVRCRRCDLSLEGKCYEKHGEIYCEHHYFREWSSYRCGGCNIGVLPSDFIYRINSGLVFHVGCHRCCQCGRQLTPGDRICVNSLARSVSCVEHHEELLHPSDFPDSSLMPLDSSSSVDCFPSGSHDDLPSSSDSFAPIDYSTIKQEFPSFLSGFDVSSFSEYEDDNKFLKRRGPRTTIKQNQLDVLNQIFSTTPKPSKHARAKLALETGLSMRVIQVWFQNRRSKERRLKHLCNYLRHYEQRAMREGQGMQGGMGYGTMADGEGINGEMGGDGMDAATAAAAFYADLDGLPVFEDGEEEEDMDT